VGQGRLSPWLTGGGLRGVRGRGPPPPRPPAAGWRGGWVSKIGKEEIAPQFTVGSQSPCGSYLVYPRKDGCRLLLFVRPRPPRIADRSTVSVFTFDSSQLTTVFTYLRISRHGMYMKCGSVGVPGPTTDICTKQLTLLQTNDNRKLSTTRGQVGQGGLGCGGVKRLGPGRLMSGGVCWGGVGWCGWGGVVCVARAG